MYQLEKLNNFNFSDKEWEQFYSKIIANGNEGILERTRKIQDDNVQILTCDNGSTKNIKLIDKKSIHNNFLQVINHYEEYGGIHENLNMYIIVF